MSIVRIGKGPRMSQAVVHGGVVHMAGQVAQAAVGGSVAEQVEEILARIDGLLAAAGTSKARLITATVWLADIRQFEAMNRAWDAWVDADEAPTRVTVETKMTGPQYDVAIAVTAAL